MPHEFTLPDVGEGVAEGELLAWHVEPGDAVTEDQVVAEVETDKAVVDVPSPVNGTVRELRAEPGDVVPVGEVVITFDVESEASTDASEASGERPRDSGEASTDASEASGEASTDASEASGERPRDSGEAAAERDDQSAEADATADGERDGRVFAPPSARRLARELGVDLSSVDGSGPGGRVSEADVRAAAEPADDGDGSGGDEKNGKQLKSAVSRIGDDGDADDGSEDDESGEDDESSESGQGGDSLTSVVSRVDREAAGDGEPADSTGGAGVEPAGRDRTLAAPATRRVADELGVDLDDVPAAETRDGEAFVTESAVREYADARGAARAADAETPATADGETGSAVGGGRPGGERREPYAGVRRTIGEAMERSKFTAPHATHHETVDATALVEAREKLKSRAAERDVELTYVPLVMKAVVAALKEHPILNTSLDEENEEVVYRDYYNVGVATATDAGLMVPVVDDVDRKGLLELAAETNDLVAKARDRSIAREEMRGGTFTITNFGAIGGEYATPIVNHPETAALGLGAIEERPVAEDGEVAARETLPLSLSIDHRVVDGADAARFVDTLGEYLEDPTLLLLE